MYYQEGLYRPEGADRSSWRSLNEETVIGEVQHPSLEFHSQSEGGTTKAEKEPAVKTTYLLPELPSG